MTRNTKITVYQVLPRLFGNKKAGYAPFGTIEENGVGKFNDFTPLALQKIRELGISHIWYTGIIEHATVTDYSQYGLSHDYAEIIKGRAGSPYAVRDYFDVHPDLAENVPERMKEFSELLDRTHQAGMKVIIDFVPNHLSRNYQSDSSPDGFVDFGKNDDPSMAFSTANDFYYIPGEPLRLPQEAIENAKLIQNKSKFGYYTENPAKVTGNDVFSASPSYSDWFETIKLNYGINLNNGGTKNFDPFPSVWKKMLQVLQFWAIKGIDGFRVDMAEMVPVEFWRWVIPQIKLEFPEIIFIAEIYKPHEYKEFIDSGFDFLYDKKGFYEAVRNVLEGHASTESITTVWQNLRNLDEHMLRFLENHDEERIGSEKFACEPLHAIPGVILAATMNQGPFMLYFGQEVGEPAEGVMGFSGDDGKTSIFDYCQVPEHQKWMNNGLFDGGNLSETQKKLRIQYLKIMNLALSEKAIVSGSFYDLMWANQDMNWYNSGKIYCYLRHTENQTLLLI
jgi:glycosidase